MMRSDLRDDIVDIVKARLNLKLTQRKANGTWTASNFTRILFKRLFDVIIEAKYSLVKISHAVAIREHKSLADIQADNFLNGLSLAGCSICVEEF
jgi:hypothetical protein